MPELPAGPNPLGAAAPEAQEIQLLWTEAAPEGSDSLVLAAWGGTEEGWQWGCVLMGVSALMYLCPGQCDSMGYSKDR